MWGIINDAGWPIWTLIFTSVIGLAIILERFFSLRDNIIIPKDLMSNLETQLKNGVIKKEELEKIGEDSLAGLMITAVIKNQGKSLEILNDTIVKTGDAISHRLEKNLHILAMISTVAPLLGLFGTIVGMVELFSSFTSTGHDVEMFARGISVALYNTAGGIVVAIPAMISHRYFRAKIDEQIQTMEEHADHVVDLINGRK